MVVIFILIEFLIKGLFYNAPGPRFEAQTLDEKISIGYGLAIGDVDGDKKPDILLVDQKQFVWYRNGDWKRFVLAENLTERDNVCIAARDLNNDGKVEIAVGAQWNPGETSDTLQSGAVFYLMRPQDPTQKWEAVRLPHEPTVHRMRWVKAANGASYLVVLPLHGRGNKNGEGQGVKIKA
ncbi:MAG: VCBS repeat-containing protein, partial [Bacteroidota bacterium]|nr:VCBS repeat-containing protein [Bacteroidota bacterium]